MSLRKTDQTLSSPDLADRLGLSLSEVANCNAHQTHDGVWKWKSLDRNWRFYEHEGVET